MDVLNGKPPSLLPVDWRSYMTLLACSSTNRYHEDGWDTYYVSLNFFSECKDLPFVSTVKRNIKRAARRYVIVKYFRCEFQEDRDESWCASF